MAKGRSRGQEPEKTIIADLSQLSVTQLIVLRLALAVSAAALGALVSLRLKKVSHLGLCVLISFAAGALLAVSLFDILPESLGAVGPVHGLASFTSGYILFFLLTRFVFHVCPACSATHTEAHHKALTTAMVVALSIHSFMDGLAIASGTHMGSSIGVLILLAVVYHKFPEGMALSLVAAGSGMGRMKVFLLCVILEAATTLAGGVLGLIVPMSHDAPWMGYLLGHVGGGFIFIVLHALFSEVVKHHPKYTLLSAFLGALSILFVQFFCL